MTNNFHSAECALRHDGLKCDCGYIKPLTKQEKEFISIKTLLKQANELFKLLLYDIRIEHWREKYNERIA
jgi:hypothetical protein